MDAAKVVQRWSDIEGENGRAVRFRGCGIVVDDIPDLFARLWSTHNPIVAIEWCLRANMDH